MKDDLPRRLRQKVVRTDNNGQSYFVSRNIDGDEAAGEIERLIAELAALRENSLAVLTRVRAYRDKVITERDALRALLKEEREELDEIAETNDVMMLKRKKLRELLRGIVARIDAALKGDGDE